MITFFVKITVAVAVTVVHRRLKYALESKEILH